MTDVNTVVDSFIDTVSNLSIDSEVNRKISRLTVHKSMVTNSPLLDYQITQKSASFIVMLAIQMGDQYKKRRHAIFNMIENSNYFGTTNEKPSTTTRFKLRNDELNKATTFIRERITEIPVNPSSREMTQGRFLSKYKYFSVFYDNANDALDLINSIYDDEELRSSLYHPHIVCPGYHYEELERLLDIPDFDKSNLLVSDKPYNTKFSKTHKSSIGKFMDISDPEQYLNDLQSSILKEDDTATVLTFKFNNSGTFAEKFIKDYIEDGDVCPNALYFENNTGSICGAKVLIRRSKLSSLVSKVILLGGECGRTSVHVF